LSKLTIKSGCVEAVFKRGRARTKGTENTLPLKTEQPAPTAEIPLRDAEPNISQQEIQSRDDGTSSNH